MCQAKRMSHACWCKTKTVEAPVEIEVSSKEVDEEMEGEGFTTEQVQSLIEVVCDETDIAEFELSLAGSKIKVSRSVNAAANAAGAAAVMVHPAVSAVADGGNALD